MASITREDRVSIQFVLPKEAHQALMAYAESQSTSEQKVFVSDLIRNALTEYMKARDVQLNLEVDRGGDRRKPK